MGLDFVLYWKKKNEELNYDDNFEQRELCYGRKSWELVHALNLPIDADDDPVVNKQDWDNLYDSMHKFITKSKVNFEIIRDFYEKADKYDELGYDVPDLIKEKIVEYETWYDKTFDTTPTLGYEFATGYLEDFYNANDKIQEIYEDENNEIRAIISY